MSLVGKWAALEDFATLFQYFWHRDFPIDERSTGARRVDWTIHIGIIVRNIADLMGLVTRFERGGRRDAVLRSTDGDEVAIEWEWRGVWENELDKLRNHKAWSVEKDNKKALKYAVFITYTHTANIKKVYNHVKGKWKEAQWPLLLILIDVAKSSNFSTGKSFNNIQMSVFDGDKRTNLRIAPAFPWHVIASRWSY